MCTKSSASYPRPWSHELVTCTDLHGHVNQLHRRVIQVGADEGCRDTVPLPHLPDHPHPGTPTPIRSSPQLHGHTAQAHPPRNIIFLPTQVHSHQPVLSSRQPVLLPLDRLPLRAGSLTGSLQSLQRLARRQAVAESPRAC